MIRSRTPFHNPPHAGRPGTTPTPSDAYRHQARRLRRLYGDNPTLLHNRLQQLAATQSKKQAVTPANPSLTTDSPVAWFFADRVALRLQAGLVLYSDRLALLKEAQSLGIQRFEANLIIAVTEHRHRPTPTSPRPAPVKRRWILPTALALTFQSLILAFIYYALWL